MQTTSSGQPAVDTVVKHPRQQLAPGQAMGTGLMGRLGLCWLVCASGHDPGAISGAGCQDSVVAYQVEPWGRYEGSQFTGLVVVSDESVEATPAMRPTAVGSRHPARARHRSKNRKRRDPGRGRIRHC